MIDLVVPYVTDVQQVKTDNNLSVYQVYLKQFERLRKGCIELTNNQGSRQSGSIRFDILCEPS